MFVYHIRIPLEREISKETLKFHVVVYILKVAQIMKTRSNIRPFYPKLVNEFSVNLPKEFNDARIREFMKVHVRGYYFGFSPTIID